MSSKTEAGTGLMFEKALLALLWGAAASATQLFGLPYLVWFAHVPIIVLYGSRRYARPDGRGPSIWWGAAGFHIIWGLSSIGLRSLHPIVPAAIPILYIPWVLPAMWILSRAAHRVRVPMVILWPALWTTTEWMWAHWSVGAMASGVAGISQAHLTPLAQAYEVGGPYLLSVVIHALNGAIADALILAGDRGVGALVRSRRVLGGAAAVVAVMLGLWGWGTWRMGSVRLEQGPRFALTQPNLPHEASGPLILRTHVLQMAMIRESLEPGEADLVLLPENAIFARATDGPEEGVSFLDDLSDLATEMDMPIIFGAFTEPDDYEPGTGLFNSVWWVAPGGEVVDIYHKSHLMPFTEYYPGRDWLAALSDDLAERYVDVWKGLLGEYGAGRPADTFELMHGPIGGAQQAIYTPICFESADAGLARKAARADVDIVLNMTSEANLGPPVFLSTLRHSVARAIQTRRPFLRSTNTGVTAVVDPRGVVTHVLRNDKGRYWHFPGILVADAAMAPDEGRTLYTRLGDWPLWPCLAVIAFTLVAYVRRRRAA